MKTQIAIIGAGPCGLLLQRMLHNRGIESIILENRNEPFLRSLSRPAIIDRRNADLLIQEKIGAPFTEVKRETRGITVKKDGHTSDLTYEQTKFFVEQNIISSSLIDRNKAAQLQTIWESKGQRFEGLDRDEVTIHYTLDARLHSLQCEYVVGCDGYFGISRPSISQEERKEEKHHFPFSWYEVRVQKQPDFDMETYSVHPDGLAIQTWAGSGDTRYFIQCENGTNPEDWTDEDVWTKLDRRFETVSKRGGIIDRKVHTLTSMISQRLQTGRLFIAGESCHIFPLIGNKGMNQGFQDVRLLAQAFDQAYNNGDTGYLNNYSENAIDGIKWTRNFTHSLFETFHYYDKWDLNNVARLLTDDAHFNSSEPNTKNLKK